MLNKPTKAQENAIYGKGSMLVSAAAGSGKTAVLVERVMNKIMPEDGSAPTPANRLLIVTFTEAAAKEMRGRIEKRLYSEIKSHPENEELAEQKHLLASADICTIDSFCIRTVRENFAALGISPDFSVGNGSEIAVERKNALNDILKPYFNEKNEDFRFLLELMGCEFDESNLCGEIERILENAMLSRNPDEYLQNLVKPFKNEFSKNHIWYDALMNSAKSSIEFCLNSVAKAAEYALYTEKADKYTESVKSISLEIETLISALNSDDYNILRSALLNCKFSSLPSASKEDVYAEKIKKIKADISSRIKKLCELFTQTPEEINADIKRVLKPTQLLINLVKEYAESCFKICNEENFFTFSFCEQLVRKLLCDDQNKAIKQAITEKYDEVMVDEYQDVNDLQDMIFTVISDNGNHLFTVGDVKQSIYGFRGSNPMNFMRKKEAAERDESKTKKVVLSNNFRSRKGVCDAVNYIFSLIMAGQTGSIVYGKEEMLNASAQFPVSDALESEFYVLDNSESNEKRLDKEAEFIAEYIKKTVNEGEFLRGENGGLRKPEYRDFAVLLRSVKGKASVVADALTEAGIPVCFNSESFSETYEVNLILSLLKVIDNPKSDLQLLTVMMSPLFGFSANDLANIRSMERKESLYSSLLKTKENEKSKKLIEFLSEFRRIFAVCPLGNALGELYAKTDILNLISLMPGGEDKRANLLLLLKIAQKYQKKSAGGIYGFLRYLEMLPDTDFKAGKPSQNGVKIMSMHTSKGLQFPICILANLTNKINNEDSVSSVLYDEKFGIGYRFYDEKSGEKHRVLNHALNAESAAKRTVDEELRLLYVAATRAEERVCFVCSLDNAESKLNSVAEKLSEKAPYISPEMLKKSTCMSDWLAACLLLNCGSKELCDIFDVKCHAKESDFYANVKFYKCRENAEKSVICTKDKPQVSEELKEKMIHNFSYRYPYEMLRGIEAKVSVSGAANEEEAERFYFSSKPSFMLENGLSAAGRGTAMHHVMQYISFEDGVSVESEIERLREWKFINDAEATAVDIESIKRFFSSDLFLRIKKSEGIRREMRFLSEVPIGEIKENTDNLPKDTKILVQGAVDLCWTDDDGVTVLDFKTDKVDNISVLKERYCEQLDIYSKACEKIIGKPVKEKIIYSFYLSDYIVF